ncbi:MAG: TolC family protein, partial [Smithellaceae bacterium]
MNRKLLLLLFVMVFLPTGCTMAPQYTRPAAPVPVEWPTGPAYEQTKSAASVEAAAKLSWLEFIKDERLQKVIATALQNNRDLRIAVLNVDRARAYYGISRVELLPTVNAVGSMSKARVPADLSSSGSTTTSERYDVYLGVSSWEIDFFGRIRSLKDKALEEYLATDQARRNTQIMLVSTVAQAYLALAADREALRLVSSTLQSQEATYTMIKKRYDVGMASGLDLRRAQSQVDMARRDVARYTMLAAQDENALNLLVGSPVTPELLPPDLSGFKPPREITAGLFS